MHARGLDAEHGDGLVEPDRRLGHQRDAFGERAGARHQLLVRHHLVDHADAQRLLRVEVIAGERPAVGGLPAAQGREQIAGVGNLAHFRLREHRLVGGDRDVGGELIPESAAHGPAVDRRDHRLAQAPHMLPMADAGAVLTLPLLDIFGVRLALRIQRPHAGGRRRRLIVAGGKRRAVAGENDGAHLAVGVGLVERAVDFRFEVARQRIHALGPVERDGRDLVLDAVKQILVAHRRALSAAVSRPPPRQHGRGCRKNQSPKRRLRHGR